MSSRPLLSYYKGFRTSIDDPANTDSTPSLPTDRSVFVPADGSQPTLIKKDFSVRIKALFKERRKIIIDGSPNCPIKYHEGSWKKFRRRVVNIVGTYWSKVSPRVKYNRTRLPESSEDHPQGPISTRIKRRAVEYAEAVTSRVKVAGAKLKKLTTKPKRQFRFYISPNVKHGIDYDELVGIVDDALIDFRKKKPEREAQLAAELLEEERLKQQKKKAADDKMRDWNWNFDDEEDYRAW